jgi:hypothetical protein
MGPRRLHRGPRSLKALLASPGGEKWLELIALQTGELFRTREITADGANPRFSPDARFVAYETGSGTARLTRVVEPAAGTRVAAEVKGHSLAFLPQGDRVVYRSCSRPRSWPRPRPNWRRRARRRRASSPSNG